MRLVKEMKLRISSEITNLSDSGEPEGEVEKTLECSECFAHFSDGEVVFSYQAQSDGADIQTDVTVSEEEVRVSRRGALCCDFIFREGLEHSSLYSVGAYSFDALVCSQKQRCILSPECVRAYVYYSMTIGGARKYVKMKIIAE